MELSKLWMAHKKLILAAASCLVLVMASVISGTFILTSQPKHITFSYNGETKSFETTAETVEDFLKEQHIALTDKDLLTPSADTPLTDELTIALHTSWEVPVHVDGQTKVVHTVKRDVASILQEAGVTLKPTDKVEPALSASIDQGTPIHVTRVDVKIVQVKEELPYQEIRKFDPTLKKGETRVLQQGQQGLAVDHYKLVSENGKEVSRELVKRDVVTPKHDRIIAVGTKVVTASNASKPAVTAAGLVSRGGKVFRPQRVLTNVTLTAYTPAGGGKSPKSPGYGRTATGVKATEGRTIAVDPSVIPLGWWVYIEGVGYRRAEDTGGAVNGKTIDVFYDTQSEALTFGRRRGKTVYVIGPHKP
ncbi:DUF348 domain-containing protein [Brevibacillus sp. SYP-B805]|uniref:3D domain-containing protein n=1 Tax=Brevibacillus sp. SYP-B805 TaxID=1578199 RepID=UPI0013ED5202|nr:3D domain-containing protein [Brevibacillus sp. SYP-B805]NGQ96493.1 DUF348 domain-containing protein [Brevibacillus sp. SYP-B805]